MSIILKMSKKCPKNRSNSFLTIMHCKKCSQIDSKFNGVNYFFQKCFNFPILDIYFCPFLDFLKRLWQNISFVSIIDFYGKGAK